MSNTMKLVEKIEKLNELIECLHDIDVDVDRMRQEKIIEKNINEIKLEINRRNGIERLNDMLKDALMIFAETKEYLKMRDIEENNFLELLDEESLDFDIVEKMNYLEKIKEVNLVSLELIDKQNWINNEIKESGCNIDELVDLTEKTETHGIETCENLNEIVSYKHPGLMLSIKFISKIGKLLKKLANLVIKGRSD